MAKVVFSSDNKDICHNCGYKYSSIFNVRIMYSCQAMNCSVYHVTYCEKCIEKMGAKIEGSFFSSHYICPVCKIGVLKAYHPLEAPSRKIGE